MTCRICGSPLDDIIDLGNQCLGGQFPLADKPDPPRFDLILTRCVNADCGLVQLRDTAPHDSMFKGYWYRSGVSRTMRKHLDDLAHDAVAMLGKLPQRVLDIGCNDGTLLEQFPYADCWGIDPSDTPMAPGSTKVLGFYPHHTLEGQKFDLVFTIACFYDVNDPCKFARAVRDNLEEDGLWVLEVSDLDSVIEGAYDAICHEHLCYFSEKTLAKIIHEAGMYVSDVNWNGCNGGTIRMYVSKNYYRTRAAAKKVEHYSRKDVDWGNFTHNVQESRRQICGYLEDCHATGSKVHLLGASTKANTWLQYCGVTPELVQCASDRDIRKYGRVTPGTRIPIITEEESRAMRPDVCVVGPWHFKDEIIAREKEFLERGGKLVLPLPRLEVVG